MSVELAVTDYVFLIQVIRTAARLTEKKCPELPGAWLEEGRKQNGLQAVYFLCSDECCCRLDTWTKT